MHVATSNNQKNNLQTQSKNKLVFIPGVNKRAILLIQHTDSQLSTRLKSYCDVFDWNAMNLRMMNVTDWQKDWDLQAILRDEYMTLEACVRV